MTTTETRPAPAAKTAQVGNLTRDVELRFSAKGTPWATCGLAVNHSTKDEDGTWHEEPATFYEVVAFGGLAEHFAESGRKGLRVVVCGRVEHDTWTGRDGEERTTAKLLADDIGVSLLRATVQVEKVTTSTVQAPIPAKLSDGSEWSDEPF